MDLDKQYVTLTEDVTVRSSMGGFKLAHFPAGHPAVVKFTGGEKPLAWCEPVDVIGNGIGEYSLPLAQVQFRKREQTPVEKAYEALCEAKDEMERMAWHEQHKK